MDNDKFKSIIFIIVIIISIISGITLPVILFTEQVLIFQLIFTILFIIPPMYIKNLSYLKTYKSMDEALYLSRHDDLTNTYNRRHFEELFIAFIEEGFKKNKKISLLYFDINNLKQINDNLGHHAGDQALQIFSKAIKDNIRESDLLARYGGDEFVVAFFNIEDGLIRKKVKSIKEQLMKNSIFIDGKHYIVEFSFGISNFPEDGDGIKELINIADKRMYLNKKGISKYIGLP